MKLKVSPINNCHLEKLDLQIGAKVVDGFVIASLGIVIVCTYSRKGSLVGLRMIDTRGHRKLRKLYIHICLLEW